MSVLYCTISNNISTHLSIMGSLTGFGLDENLHKTFLYPKKKYIRTWFWL